MRQRIRRICMAAVAAMIVVPAPAHAQLGGLLKKAKKAVETQASQNPNARPSSAFGPELTEASMTAVLKGLNAQTPIFARINALNEQRDSVSNAEAKARDGHGAEQQAYDAATDTRRECVSQALSRIDDTREAKVQGYAQSIIGDPAKLSALQKAMIAAQAQSAQLMAKGDTAGAARVQVEAMSKQMGIAADPKADTVQAERGCGKPPAKPGWMLAADADAARVEAYDRQTRDLEHQVQAEGARVAGMSPAQFALAHERILNWYHGGRDNNSVQQFGAEELKVLHAHEAEIEKLEGAH